MKKRDTLHWIGLVLVLCTSLYFYTCGKVVPKEINWIADFEEASKIAKSQNKNMILEFYTDWCKWCKILEDSTFTDTSVIRFSMDFVFFKTDAEKDTVLANRYQVAGYPTIILANPSGEEIDRIVGYAPALDLISDFKDYLKGEGTLADLENKLKTDSTNADLWFRVGEKYHERRRFDEAIVNYQRVISLDPEDRMNKASHALFNIGLVHMRQKEYPKAIKEFSKLVSAYPKSELKLDADEYIPYSYEKIGDTTKAISLYKKILKKYPNIDPAEKNWIENRIKKLEGKEEKNK